jgi:formylglycine-generating enzyme
MIEPPDDDDDDDFDFRQCSAELAPPLDMQVTGLSFNEALLGTGQPQNNRDAEGPPFVFTVLSSPRLFVDVAEVSNDRFAAFVTRTGYQTDAEKRGWSTVWAEGNWSRLAGATWRFPAGSSGRSVFSMNREDHPVIHVSLFDALAFCTWAGEHEMKRLSPATLQDETAPRRLPSQLTGRLPSEDEWEFVARGGRHQKLFPWGDSLLANATKANGTPKGPRHRANLFQGNNDTANDGFVETAPSSAYGPQNSFGLHHLIGNVAELTSSPYCTAFATGGEVSKGLRMAADVKALLERAGIRWRPSNRTSVPLECSKEQTSRDVQKLLDSAKTSPDSLKEAVGQLAFVAKGGSYLCDADSSCHRHHLAAREKIIASTSRQDLGFRCLYEDASGPAPQQQMLEEEVPVQAGVEAASGEIIHIE